jgi:hypothetical protein
MSIPWTSVQLFKKRFPEKDFEVKLWDRKDFYPEYFQNANEVVFMLPDNEFNYSIDSLPIGVKRELKEALRSGKKTYVAYITSGGDYNIYEAEANGLIFGGVKGTANTIFNNTEADRKNFIYETDSYKVPHYGSFERDTFNYAVKVKHNEPDRRLLLMM